MMNLRSRTLGIPWAGTIANIITLTVLLTSCLSDHWLAGNLGNVGLWKQCYYGLPCTSPTEVSSYVARIMIVISLVMVFFSLILGVGALGFFMRDFPVHILACFTVGLAGFISILGTSIYIAGYYLGMAVAWSWYCSLVGSLMALFVTPPLYWYSYHIQVWFKALLMRVMGERDRTPRMIHTGNSGLQSHSQSVQRFSNIGTLRNRSDTSESGNDEQVPEVELNVYSHKAMSRDIPDSTAPMVERT
eukprot:CFRG4430T1